MLEFLQYKQVLRNTKRVSNKQDLLPRFEDIGDNKQLIIQNLRIFRENNYKKYLDGTKLQGFVNYDPQQFINNI